MYENDKIIDFFLLLDFYQLVLDLCSYRLYQNEFGYEKL